MGKKRRDNNVIETSAMPMWRFVGEEMTPRRAASLAPSVAAHMSDLHVGLQEAFHLAEAIEIDASRDPSKLLLFRELMEENYRSAPVSWCDPSFFDLLGAAAMPRVDDGVRFEELVADESDEPCGWLTFGGGGIDISRYVPSMPSNQRVKAIHWWTVNNGPGFRWVTITCWVDRMGVGDSPTMELSGRGLVHYRFSSDEDTASNFLLSLIVMFEPVARSKRVQRLDRTARPKRAKSKSADRPFVEARLVQVEETDEGMDPELAAALGATSSRNGTRLHWVRGHSKRQWVPSVQKHRRIWVDGYDRGDARLGVVPRRPVLTTARMDGRTEG